MSQKSIRRGRRLEAPVGVLWNTWMRLFLVYRCPKFGVANATTVPLCRKGSNQGHIATDSPQFWLPHHMPSHGAESSQGKYSLRSPSSPYRDTGIEKRPEEETRRQICLKTTMNVPPQPTRSAERGDVERRLQTHGSPVGCYITYCFGVHFAA